MLQLVEDIMTTEKPKQDYYREAVQLLNTGERAGQESGERTGVSLAFLTRGAGSHQPNYNAIADISHAGIQQLATRDMEDAMRSFEVVLVEKPTNVVALLGKVRFSCFWIHSRN